MSNAYAVAGVSAALQGLLIEGLLTHGVSGVLGDDVLVSVLPPDQVGADLHLNVFLYQVTPNLGWRNEHLPSRNFRSQRISNQPLALDLHYLISAHTTGDLFAEVVLGSAMQTLHERPFFTRDDIGSLISISGPPGLLVALNGSGLADQIEQIKITPEYLSNEDMSKLWSAAQSNYRSSAAYVATVVLVEAQNATRAPLPVLTRDISAQPSLIPPTPTIVGLEYASQQTVGRLGEIVVIQGYHLNGPNVRVQLSMQSENIAGDFPLAGTPTNERVEFIMPVDATIWRAGVYQISLTMDDAGGHPIESNSLALINAPAFSNFNAVRNPDNSVSIDLTVVPDIHDDQSVSLILSQNEQIVESFAGAQTAAANFEFPDIAVGDHWARIRVDGIDSVLINRNTTTPEFIPSQRVTLT